MTELATTHNFFKKVVTFFKFNRQFTANETVLADAFNIILKKAKDNNYFEKATEYCETNGLKDGDDLFYKYSIDNSGVYFIFVICTKCGGKLKCAQQCSQNPALKICFHDLWIKN